MVVRAAGDQIDALAPTSASASALRFPPPARISLEILRLQRFAERHRLGRDDVHQRSALDAGEDGLVDLLGALFLAQDHAAPRAAQGLVRRRGHEVGVGTGFG